MTKNIKTFWTALTAASLLFQVGIALLVTGHDATPYGTLDDAGKILGFNDPITLGHFRIMLSNVSIGGFLESVGWYASLGMLAHVAGVVIIWNPNIQRGIRQWFFGLQTLLFPLAWFPPFWWVFVLMFRGPFDGESIQDGPVSVVVSQASWWLASIIIFFWDLAHEEFVQDQPILQPSKL